MMELKEPIVVGAQIFGQVRDRWEQLDPRRRLALVVILVGVVGSLGLWMFLSSQVPYQVAFQNLRADDEAAVVDKLKEFQIPYEIDDGGTIRVPASLVNEARVRVAGAGVLKGSAVGFEIFNQPAFGISDFVQQVNYQRALEGELERSIEQIDGIQSARVHLAIPQPSVFLRQQRDPSAAVIIGLKPGRTIDKAQEQAIVNLVVGAVEGMKPSQVVLLDTRGQLLHKEGDSGGIGTLDVGDQYATQRAMEQDLASRLQNLLDRVVGPGRASVQVSLQLDWTKGELTSETYNPNNQQPLVRTSQDVKETQGPGVSIGGVPGVTSNVPTYQQNPTPTSQSSGSERTESTRTYELSRIVEKTDRAPGTLEHVAVAVAVDSKVADAAMVDKITKLVQGAVGFDAQRGDTVTVVSVPIQSDQRTVLPTTTDSQRVQTMELVRTAALVVGPLLAILALAFLLLRRRPARHYGEIRTMPVPAVAAPSPSTPDSLDATAIPELPPTRDPRRTAIREELSSIAEKDPALVAAILQGWMKEDRRTRS